MKENKGLIMNVGTSSVVLILLVLAMSVFALLSIRASNSEVQLAEKTGESIQEYYIADTTAEYALCYIQQIITDSKIEELEKELNNMKVSKQEGLEKLQEVELYLKEDVVFTGKQKDELGAINYAILVEEGKRLEVSLELRGDRSLSVKTWRMVKDSWNSEEIEQEVELWDGSVMLE